MSPDRVGRPASIASWMHGVAGKPGSVAQSGRGSLPSPGAQSVESGQGRSLRAELAALVEGVDLDSEDAVRTLRRPVIRRILLNEFGSDFAEYPDLAAMTEQIDAAMDADPASLAQFLRMLRDLSVSGPP